MTHTDMNHTHTQGSGEDTPEAGRQIYTLDHIAVESSSIAESVRWHIERLTAEVLYEDSTWALLRLADGTKVALVTPGSHPSHIAIRPKSDPFGDTKTHRDGSYSFYEKDPHSSAVYEWIWYPNQKE